MNTQTIAVVGKKVARFAVVTLFPMAVGMIGGGMLEKGTREGVLKAEERRAEKKAAKATK